jgi:anhydro-N-acetylmuramic acid kinase
MIAGGIMSGTSLDGVDAALVEVGRKGVKTLGFISRPYPEEVRRRLMAVSNCETHTREIARLHFELPELYASAFKAVLKKAGMEAGKVRVVGCHGQTIYHEGRVATLQIGDGSVLAERLGIAVVSDFRTRDIAAGGQGAPLVPYVDYLLYGDKDEGRVALNIGGIANITHLPAGAGADAVTAFDTGPGNMVIDQLMALYRGEGYDKDGAFAASGSVDPMVVEELLRDDYYSRKPPKSAGREQYGSEFVSALMARGMSPEDTVATATLFSAAAAAEGIYRFAEPRGDIGRVIVSGGGVHNRTLMRFLRAELADMEVAPSSEFGVDPDAKEAIAFAVLAVETVEGRPSNLPGATGAKRAVVLGKISPA